MTVSAPTPYWNESQKGFIFALACYVFWGLFPLYWYPLLGQPISAEQLLAQRVCWSALFALILMSYFRLWVPLWQAIHSRRVWLVFTASAAALSINWLSYLWAITHRHVLDSSLGYFMAPLVSIALGRIFLKDRLARGQWIGVIFAGIGVVWLAVLGGHLPWIALCLSISWGFYGLLRKQAPLGALAGFTSGEWKSKTVLKHIILR